MLRRLHPALGTQPHSDPHHQLHLLRHRRPERPKSHNRGVPAAVGRAPSGDLLLLQGVLALDWRRRKWGVLPRLEVSELAWHNPPHIRRLPLWLHYAPAVQGAEQVRFIKLCCHGAPEEHREALLGSPMRRFLEQLCNVYNDGQNYRLMFMTCREMIKAVHALEQGKSLDC